MKKTIALTGLVTLTGFVLPTAQADALLFPVLTRSPSVATIISVVNKDTSGVLNVNYFTKAPDLSTPCTDEGVRQIVAHGRPNDLISFDASGNFLGSQGGPLFNDPESFAPYGNINFAASGTSVARGVLIVDDGDDDGEDLYGEALVLEIAGGAAFGYRAFNPNSDQGASGPLFGVGNDDNLGEILNDGDGSGNAAVTVLPPSEWTTRFFVTPVADGGGTAANQRFCETCSVSIYFSPDKAGTTAGLFDRDAIQRAEPFAPAPLPTAAKNIVCTGAVGITDILPSAIVNQINTQGGWGYVQIRQGTSGNTEDSAAVLKLEFNLVGGGTTDFVSPDFSTSFTGTVNNGVWLHNFGNAQGVSGF